MKRAARPGLLVLVAAVLGATSGLVPAAAVTNATPQPPAPVVAAPTLPPLAVLPAVATTPAVSADGKLVVYAGPPALDDGRTSTVSLLDRETGITTELTVATAGMRAGNSVRPAISADGCHVVVITEIAFDLFRDDDTGSRWDVYHLTLPSCGGSAGDWDLVSTSPAPPASTSTAGSDSATAIAAGDDVDVGDTPAISGSGAVVAYTRRFGPLPVAGGPTASSELTAVEVVDLTVALGAAGRTRPVAGTPAAPPSTTFRYRGLRQPALSDDGRTVAFVSDATSAEVAPAWGDGPAAGGFAGAQVYVWDRQAADPATAVVAVSSPVAASANGDASSPVLSANGRYVAFTSAATNLVAGAVLPPCLSVPSSSVEGAVANFSSAAPIVPVPTSPAVTTSAATVDAAEPPAAASAASAAAEPLRADGAPPAVAAARFGAGTALAAETTRCPTQVYRVDLADRTTLLVSREDGAPGSTPVAANAGAGQPAINFDGSQVAFVTRATNLFDVVASPTGATSRPTTGDTSRDMARGEIVLAAVDGTSVSRVSISRVSVLADGVTPAPFAQAAPRISGDARTVVFDTSATAEYQPQGSSPGGTRVVIVNRAPQLSMADADLGTVAIGYPGGEWFVNVINHGPTPFVPAKISVSNPNFGITGGTCVLGVAVATGGTCEVHLILTPSVGGQISGTLSVAEAGFGAVSVTSQLRGGGGEPVLTSDRGGAGFGLADVGAYTVPQTFTIINSGFSAANLIGATTGGSNPADFRVLTTTCTGLLDIGQSCAVDVTFVPKAGGQRSALVTVSTEAGQYTSVLVGGEGRYTATMSTSSDRLFSGASFGVGGNGFPANSTITLLFVDGVGGTYQAQANKDGAFLSSVVLGANERPGPRTLLARTADGTTAAAEVTVVPSLTSGSGPASPYWPSG